MSNKGITVLNKLTYTLSSTNILKGVATSNNY